MRFYHESDGDRDGHRWHYVVDRYADPWEANVALTLAPGGKLVDSPANGTITRRGRPGTTSRRPATATRIRYATTNDAMQ